MHDEPQRGREALHVTVRVNDRPVSDSVVSAGAVLDEGPVHVRVGRQNGRYVLQSEEGTQEVPERESARVGTGNVVVEASPIRRFRLPRWIAEQSQLVLPLVMLATTVLVMQIALLLSLFASPSGGETGYEPSPELLARLLREEFEGAERGVVAQPMDRPKSERKIESFYLPAGSAGPITQAGGAAEQAASPIAGDPRPRKAEEAKLVVEELGITEKVEAPPIDEPTIDELADPLADPSGEQEEHDQSVEVTEGWGLTDWYDTEDARRDAKEIEQQLKLSKELLKLDPDNVYGLSLRAYYEYLAMDWEGAENTYDRLLKLDGASGAPWNNLALVYKRKGDYVKEEELYRKSLMVEPDVPNTYVNLALCVARQGRYDEALGIMKRLEREIPGDPYADLHRAKIYAIMGKEEEAYKFLKRALQTMRKLDTLHNIEFQQDVRIDPAFTTMREQPRFKALLSRYYGERPGAWWLLGLDGKSEE